MSNYNANNIRLSACRVRWGGRDLGMTKGGVDVTIKTDTKQIQVDQYGNTPVNEYILGRTLMVKCPFAETDLDNLYALLKQAGATMNDNGVVATGTVTYSVQPSANDTVVVNGHTFTFVMASPALNQVLIGASLAATLANLVAVLQQSTDPNVQQGVYSATSTVLNVSYFRSGAIGNAFTLASTGTAATVSTGGALKNGADNTGIRNVTINAGISTQGITSSLLSTALPLVLHPFDRADNDTSEDFTVFLANTAGNLSFSYKINDERVFNLDFTGYPDLYNGGKLAKYGM